MQPMPEFDAYNFPEDEDLQRQLAWMGADYVSYIGSSIYKAFRQQDPGCEMIALKNEAPPRITIELNDGTQAIRSVQAVFTVQVAMRESNGSVWRLYTTVTFDAQDVDVPQETLIRYHIDIDRSEPVA